MVIGETDDQEVVSSNPGTGYYMDRFSHLFGVDFVMLFEKTKYKFKESVDGRF